MIALVSMSLFYIIRHLCNSIKNNKLIVEISKMSYGVYLSHFILIYLLGIFWQRYGNNKVLFYVALNVILLINFFVIVVPKKYFPRFSKLVFRY